MECENNYYLDELVNEGGVTCSEDLINFATSKISHGLYCMNMKPGDIKMGCTTFTAKDKSGNNIFARNYDYYKDAICVLKTPAKENKHATLSMIDLSKLDIKVVGNDLSLIQKLTMLAAPYAPMDGMNDAGLSVSILTSRQGADPEDTNTTAVGTNLNTEKLDLTVTSFVRYILDKCSTVDEAVKITENIDIHEFDFSSFHYSVADKSGKSAVIEWLGENNVMDTDGTNRKLCVTYKNNNEQNQITANFVSKPGYYVTTNSPYGKDRADIALSLLSKTNGVINSSDDAFAILEKVARRNHKEFGGVGDEVTLYSSVYDMNNLTLTLVDNEKFNETSHK